MRILLLLLLLCCGLGRVTAQVDFFGRSITGQSPNSASTFFVLGVSNETSLVSTAAQLSEFEHARQQIGLFNLGIDYTTQVLGVENFERIDINLDTVVGGTIVRNSYRLYAGLQYETLDRTTRSLASFGASRFKQGGLALSVSHDISFLEEGREFTLIHATARDQSLLANICGGFEAGWDSGFSVTLEESGILQLTTDHLVRDVAAGNLTFEEYKAIEEVLHAGLRYQAPKNNAGTEWYFLTTLKAQLYSTPFAQVPLKFTLGVEGGLDVGRLRKRNQNRLELFVRVGYLFY